MLMQDGSVSAESDVVSVRTSPGLRGKRVLRQLTDVHLTWWNRFPMELGVMGAFGGKTPSSLSLSAWLRWGRE